jgi:hypothetical protein
MMNGRNRMVEKGKRWSWERKQWKNLRIDTDTVIKLRMREINKTEYKWKAIRLIEHYRKIWELNVYGA